jgi:hypothetical protein
MITGLTAGEGFMADPLSAALKQSFNMGNGSYFPAANRMNDDMTAGSIYGGKNLDPFDPNFGGKATPTPAPRPTPNPKIRPTELTLGQLYEHFGVENPVKLTANAGRPLYQNAPDQQVYNFRHGSGTAEGYGGGLYG